MRDLSCLSKEEQKAVANWLSQGACGCPFGCSNGPVQNPKTWDDLDALCTKTCGTVFPECQDEILMFGGTIRIITYCPCSTLTCKYVISELEGLPHD